MVQSPKSDIFVVMLAIALGAIVLGCLLMIIMFGRYSFSTKVSALSVPPEVGVLTQARETGLGRAPRPTS